MQYRDKGSDNVCSKGKREIRSLTASGGILFFIKSPVWKTLFGKEADDLELDPDQNDTYYIIEKKPVTNLFTSGVEDGDNCANFIAGIVQGILNSAKLFAKVTINMRRTESESGGVNPYKEGNGLEVMYVIKFSTDVLQRE